MGKIQNIRNMIKSKKMSKKSKKNSKKNNKQIRTKKPSYRQKAGSCSKNPICALLNWLSESSPEENKSPEMPKSKKPEKVKLLITAADGKGKGTIEMNINVPGGISNEQTRAAVQEFLNNAKKRAHNKGKEPKLKVALNN